MTRLTTPFGFCSTAAEVLTDVDLRGKTAIVTGGAGGIGAETVRELARAGADVTIAARRPEAAESVAKSLRSETGQSAITVRQLDLADPCLCSGFRRGLGSPARYPGEQCRHHGLAAARAQHGRTGDAVRDELPWSFRADPWPAPPWLRAAGEARVVCVASTGSLWSPVLWDDPAFRFTPLSPDCRLRSVSRPPAS